jgi:hypothetical protein
MAPVAAELSVLAERAIAAAVERWILLLPWRTWREQN